MNGFTFFCEWTYFCKRLILYIISSHSSQTSARAKKKTAGDWQCRRPRSWCSEDWNYLKSVKWEKTEIMVLATVDIILMKMSSATPTTSLRVSPTVSPVTAAL